MKKLIPFVIVFFTTTVAEAQPKPSVQPIPVTKFKPPVVQSFLGRQTGKAAACTAEEAKQLVQLPLKVMDAKKQEYQIASYQVAYTRIVVTEDEQTGKPALSTDQVGQRFTQTPLPEIWQTNMIETLRKGEMIHIFDIICYDQQKRLFFAPELKIQIQ